MTEGIDSAQFNNMVKRIEKMTDQNDHNGARMLGAELLEKAARGKGKMFIELYKAIDTIATKEGHLPREISDYRFSVDKKMWAVAKQNLDKEQYDAFYGAY